MAHAEENVLPGYNDLMRSIEEKMKLDSKKEQIGDYHVEGALGEGTFGTVKLGVHFQTQRKVALKFIDYSKCKSQKEKDNIKREIQIMQLLDHPNIVRLQEVFELPERNATCLVLEYIQGGELFDYIVANGKLKENEAARFFRQMLQGAEYCHMNFVIHRDLKPENLLLDANKNLKINDFGLSNLMQPGRFLESYCGSPLYVAPEILAEVHYIGPEVDIWAMGVILFVMVSGYVPWDGNTLREQMQNALRANYEIPGHVSKECAELIHRILTVDPRKRATIAEIKSHPWVNRGFSGPPSSYIPVSHSIHSREDVDPEILENLKKVGFTEHEVLEDLITGKSTKQSSVLYFLMVDKKRREQHSEIELTPRSRAALHAQTRDKSFELEFPHKVKVRKTEEHSPPRSANEKPVGSVRQNPDIVQLRINAQNTSLRITSERLNNAKKPFLFQIFKRNKDSEPEQQKTTTTSPESAREPSRRRLTVDMGDVSPLQTSASEPTITEDDEKELRVSKGAFTVETTTVKALPVIQAEIERVLTMLSFPFKRTKAKYTVKSRDGKIQVSIEICKISKLDGFKGIKFKRIGGDLWKYKEMYENITRELRL